MAEILYAFFIEVLSVLGVIAGGGFLISLCNKAFYKNVGSGAKAICYVTGVFGVPVHELSHALFCVLFGHKIVEIKWFQIGDDGTLGYVIHTYNKKNPYQRIGNFFIGIAPILGISAVLYLIALWLIPATIGSVTQGIGAIGGQKGFGGLLGVYFSTIGRFFIGAGNYRWWLFLLVGSAFALHMNLSSADVKGALSGLAFVLIALLIVDVILRVIGGKSALYGAMRVMLVGGVFIAIFLTLALVVNLFMLLLSFLARLIKRR